MKQIAAKHANAARPRLPKRECQGCDYFVREISGGPGCYLQQRAVAPDGYCGGFQFRQSCRVCGCSAYDPCQDGCWWVESDLCSTCAAKPPEDAKK